MVCVRLGEVLEYVWRQWDFAAANLDTLRQHLLSPGSRGLHGRWRNGERRKLREALQTEGRNVDDAGLHTQSPGLNGWTTKGEDGDNEAGESEGQQLRVALFARESGGLDDEAHRFCTNSGDQDQTRPIALPLVSAGAEEPRSIGLPFAVRSSS